MAPDEIQLNKPLWEAGSRGRPQHPREKRGDGPAPPPTPPPVFGGFWVRLMALTVDLLTIVIVHNLLAAVGLDDFLYTISPWCPVIGIVAMLIMLVVLPTRIWPGQTLGKRLLKLRVVTQDFEDPPVRAYLQRFVIIAAVFIPGWLYAGPLPLREWLIAHPIPMGILQGLVFGLVLTEISLFILHPAKRGFHDLWARTYVVRLDAADPNPAHALAQMGDRGEMRVRQARRMAFLMFPLLVVIFSAQLTRSAESPYRDMTEEVRADLVTLAGPGSHFGLMGFGATQQNPTPEAWGIRVFLPPLPDVAWEDAESDPAHAALAERALDLVEVEFDGAAHPQMDLTELPYVGGMVEYFQSYAVIPGPLNLGRLAGNQRAARWNRQLLTIPVSGESLLPGTPLVPFSPSPEVTASPASE